MPASNVPVGAVSAVSPPASGVRAFVRLEDRARSDSLNDRLHFCVFENGEDDWIYVGVESGLWSSGEFDLCVHGRLVFTGKVEHLLYGGLLLRMGDVIRDGADHSMLTITRVAGVLK